jgi:hypothetical protein
MAEAKEPKWQNSDAKKQLRRDIMNKVVTEEMKPKAVQARRPEYQLFKKEKFATNLRALRKVLSIKDGRAAADSAALANDLLLHPPAAVGPGGYPQWADSVALRLLQLDVDEDLHNILKPRELYVTRAEYQIYPLVVFRKHIDQERDHRKQLVHWETKYQKKYGHGHGRER